jgi:hypothetical protein
MPPQARTRRRIQSESSRFKIGERLGSVAFHPLNSSLAVSGATSEVGVYDGDGTGSPN